ncbi:cell division protein DivIB [Ruminiclostridium hungatei]|uniref:Cell division protein DivIB n=1 Tax=Ruminiclostridium hungatei TaxID=48256 RepID=A0A1V4SL39_RUMHU|nr:FtsQ-type POTRA domain-containing protein [Ruminiclostridium hungatei]OPX44609.1 cell division protein DivIB [Ruminiclostridium hungatei]
MKKTPEKTYVKKKSKKARIRMRRIRRFLLFILVVTGIIVFAKSSVFIVDKIEVSGNKKYSSSAIILNTGLVPGKNAFEMLGEKPKNLLSFRFNDLEREIYDSMPYIKSVSIRPALPTAIKIKVQERTPFAILDKEGKSLLIDREGFVLEEMDGKSPLPDNYFRIIGISVDSFKLGQAVKYRNNESLMDLLSFCDLVVKSDKDDKELKLYKRITKVDLSDAPYISVEFEKRITVKFGDLEDANYQIGVFRYLLVNNITAKQKGSLDFTKGSNPYFVPSQ